jgi:hypothetical protein
VCYLGGEVGEAWGGGLGAVFFCRVESGGEVAYLSYAKKGLVGVCMGTFELDCIIGKLGVLFLGLVVESEGIEVGIYASIMVSDRGDVVVIGRDDVH